MEQIINKTSAKNWWTVRMRDSSYKMQQMKVLSAKTEEGSLDDQKQQENLHPIFI